jgi:RNA polymerase sigma-70 factor (ECF subfamily)
MRVTMAGPLDIDALFSAQGEFVHRVAQRLTGSSALADDVAQEVFLLAWRRRGELKDEKGIRTWLYRAAVNVNRQRTRGLRRYTAALDRHGDDVAPAPPDPERILDRDRCGLRIRACVARLTEAQREVFVLYELEELEGDEIASILDIPVNTVWSRLRLARRTFRELWTGDPP